MKRLLTFVLIATILISVCTMFGGCVRNNATPNFNNTTNKNPANNSNDSTNSTTPSNTVISHNINGLIINLDNSFTVDQYTDDEFTGGADCYNSKISISIVYSNDPTGETYSAQKVRDLWCEHTCADFTKNGGQVQKNLHKGTPYVICTMDKQTTGVAAFYGDDNTFWWITVSNNGSDWNTDYVLGLITGLEHHSPSHTALQIVTSPKTGVAYKLGMLQNNLGKILFFTGSIASREWYLSTSDNVLDSVDVYLENYSDGYRIYFWSGNQKLYIDIYQSDSGHTNLRLTTNPTAYYTWNNTYNTFVANIDGEYWFIGNYNTFEDLKANNLNYIAEDFPVSIFQ